MARVRDDAPCASRVVVTRVTRRAVIPDELRLARCLRAPELGPRVLFFSGGSAMRATSRQLKLLTHNSVHLITPFDSGGSSAALRRAFDMPSVGDLRNRLIALAEETALGSPEIYRLFSHRLPLDASAAALRDELGALAQGSQPLLASVPQPMRQIIRTHLRAFAGRAPADFDLRGASVGNLILAGGYLQHERDLHAVIFDFTKLVEARGLVRPTVCDSLHLAGRCRDGTTVVGQHRLTGKEHAPLASPLSELWLVNGLQDAERAFAAIDAETEALIEQADLIVFPVGSFYSSVLANLLPAGVGRAIARASCPKVYVPNLGSDPEQLGMSLSDSVRALIRTAERDVGETLPPGAVVQQVWLDQRGGRYDLRLDTSELSALGVEVLDLPLARADEPSRLDPQAMARALVSVSG